MLEIFNYTVSRDRMDRVAQSGQTDKCVPPGEMVESVFSGEKLFIRFEKLELRISMPFGDCYRITWKECSVDTFLNSTFSSIALAEGTNVHISEEDVRISGQNSALIIHRDASITLLSRESRLRKEAAPLIGDDVIRTRCSVRSDSSIHGFGEKALGMDLRNSRLTLWNHDADGSYGPGDDPLYIGIPLYHDLKEGAGYFAFYNNPARGTVDVCYARDDEIAIDFEGGGLDYFLGVGEVPALMEMITKIGGRPFIPPEWSLGFHQSRYSYMSTEEVLQVANDFQDNNLPLSAVHIDIDHMDGYRVFTFHNPAYSGIKQASSDLISRGVHLVSIIDPGVKQDHDWDMYREGEKDGLFVRMTNGDIAIAPVWPGPSAFPDFTRNDVRCWWSEKYNFYLDNGITGFWHDMNEPTAFTFWGDNTLPMSAVFSQGPHSLVHNLYGFYMAKAAYDRLSKLSNREKPFILTRSGWAGIQRYAFVWTGDTASTWAEMQSTISTVINLGLSGIPYTGVDIGGFSGSPSADLYLRWFQMGAFFPFFRVHSAKGTERREPWSFGKATMDSVRKFLELRYRLIPFYYTLCHEASVKGYPVIRPPFWIDHSYDHAETDMFLVGNEILVLPVTRKNIKKFIAKLPQGTWFSLWDDTVYEDICSFEVKIDEIPILVRSGSMIPMKENGEIMVHVYPGDNGSGRLYLDDDKINPKSCTYEFSLKKEKEEWTLKYSSRDGGLGLLPCLRFVFHGSRQYKIEPADSIQIGNGNIITCPEPAGEIRFS